MKKQTLALSDVHLSQAHPDDPTDPTWMRYRRREHHPDTDFAALVDHILARHGADPIELVFNGDIFDFDTPWVKNGDSSFDEFPPTDEGCTEHVRLMLADHAEFFRAAARILAAGHEVTFLSGNHDLELYWPGVRKAIADELVRLARAENAPDADDALRDRVRFRAWFHVTSDRLYFEHGSQYDIHNGVRHAIVPLTRDRDRLHPVLGKLAFRRTGARMGYFNPYYEETFYMGLFGYLGHFARSYALSKRHIVRTWASGALSTVAEIWRHRHFEDRSEETRRAVRAELGDEITDEAIDATHALRARPAEETMIPVLRELWVDRVALACLIVLVTSSITIAAGWKAGAIAIAIEVALFVVYELVTPKPDIRTYDSAPPTVLRLFEIHRVHAICMGHTHRPFGRFSDQGLYANSGAWCPAFEDVSCTKPVLSRRPVLWLTTETDGERTVLSGGLHWWSDGALHPDPDHSRQGGGSAAGMIGSSGSDTGARAFRGVSSAKSSGASQSSTFVATKPSVLPVK